MKGNITISRDNKDRINITIRDESSCITLFDGQMTLENFAQCITGLGYVEIDFALNKVENVGKTREHKTVEIELGETGYTNARKEIAIEKLKELESDGWVLNDTLSSQGSFFYKNGKNYCRAMFVRYV